MKQRSLLYQILRIFGVVVLIVLVTVAIITGIGWWAGWQTEEKFKTAIQVAGLVLIGIGFLGIKGNRDKTRSFEYKNSMSVTKDKSWKKPQRSLVDLVQSFTFLLVMFVAGGICMAIGWLM